MDIGVLLIAAVAFFFILAACLVILVISLKARENTELIKVELAALRKEIERLTTGAR